MSRSHLKNVFWPNLCVGPSFQVLDILQYACGLKRGPALILNQNPLFEIASNTICCMSNTGTPSPTGRPL